MTSFALALVSIAFVLVNLGIGWALAKGQCRYSKVSAARSLATTRSASHAEDSASMAGVLAEDGVVMCSSECESSDDSVTATAAS